MFGIHNSASSFFISDYKEIFVIPASATNINIQELAPSSNFLGNINHCIVIFVASNWLSNSPGGVFVPVSIKGTELLCLCLLSLERQAVASWLALNCLKSIADPFAKWL